MWRARARLGQGLTLNGAIRLPPARLYNAIGAGAHPEWELGVQVMPDSEDEYFEGIDLLDATKIVPEELVAVQPIGRMTLNRNPTNFFAEVEQVAYHVGHLVRGIEVVDDPLMQARLFSYLDTQLTRLGGPNFAQIPINRRTPRSTTLPGRLHAAACITADPVPASRRRWLPFRRERDGGTHVPRVVQGARSVSAVRTTSTHRRRCWRS